MSEYQQRDNSGSLFKNDRRDKDTQPNARGKALIDGVAYEVSAWTKKDRNGNPWQSLSFKKMDAQARQEHVEQTRQFGSTERRGSLKDQLDDDICF